MEMIRKRLFRVKGEKQARGDSPDPDNEGVDLLVAKQFTFDPEAKPGDAAGAKEGRFILKRRTSDGELYSHRRKASSKRSSIQGATSVTSLDAERARTIYEIDAGSCDSLGGRRHRRRDRSARRRPARPRTYQEGELERWEGGRELKQRRSSAHSTKSLLGMSLADGEGEKVEKRRKSVLSCRYWRKSSGPRGDGKDSAEAERKKSTHSYGSAKDLAAPSPRGSVQILIDGVPRSDSSPAMAGDAHGLQDAHGLAGDTLLRRHPQVQHRQEEVLAVAAEEAREGPQARDFLSPDRVQPGQGGAGTRDRKSTCRHSLPNSEKTPKTEIFSGLGGQEKGVGGKGGKVWPRNPAAANAISLPHIHQLSDYDDDTAGHDTNTENDQDNDLAKST
ncbi:hypothetical protein C7M84_025385 [Penaeus vannamei]|uniref:Uncharacterized protein n=1 Tax=Penaeus vannamei TaxID=6689 RepID=A0A3R7QX61_PENVA|nr:hypothetical protein C7M84_025385 [Penaeus vannamei]